MKLRIATSAALLAALLAGPAAADDFDKALLDSAISIEKAIDTASDRVPNARVVEAELDDDDGGRWEVKLIDASGKKSKVYIDARSGEVIRLKS